jgi:hypothetical protein
LRVNLHKSETKNQNEEGHFLIEPSKIGHNTFIFSLCDNKELYGVFFGRNACAEVRDKFGAKILKMENKARL